MKLDFRQLALIACMLMPGATAVSQGSLGNLQIVPDSFQHNFQERFCMFRHSPLPPVVCGIPEKVEIISLALARGLLEPLTWKRLSSDQRDILVDDLFLTIFPQAGHWKLLDPKTADQCPQSGLIPSTLFRAMHVPNATWRSYGPLAKALGVDQFSSGHITWNVNGPITKKIWDALIAETATDFVVNPNLDRIDWGRVSSVSLPSDIGSKPYGNYPYLAFFLSNPTRQYQREAFRSAVFDFFSTTKLLAIGETITADTPLLMIDDNLRGCSANDLMESGMGRLLNFSPNFLRALMFAIDQNNNPFGGVKCGCFPGKSDW